MLPGLQGATIENIENYLSEEQNIEVPLRLGRSHENPLGLGRTLRPR